MPTNAVAEENVENEKHERPAQNFKVFGDGWKTDRYRRTEQSLTMHEQFGKRTQKKVFSL